MCRGIRRCQLACAAPPALWFWRVAYDRLTERWAGDARRGRTASSPGTGRGGRTIVSRLRAVIVDDEPLSRRAMRQLLDARGDVEVIAECPDAITAEPRL